MKKILKRTSAVLAAVMTVTSMGLTALADNYTDSEVYYNDFSSGTVDSTAIIGSGSNAYLVDFANSNIASRYFESNAPTTEISDGKLKVISNGGYYNNSGQNGRTRTVTYIKFDKDFDVSANTTKKLIVSYDVALNDFDFYDEKNASMGNIQRYLFDAGLFEYTDSKTAATGVFLGGSSSGNAANIGMAFQIPYTNTETNKAEKAGLLIATGNSSAIQTNVGVGLNVPGIFNKPLGNVFHVEYEVTPATETTQPRITKITMSDNEHSTVYDTPANNQYFDITGKTKVSGIRLDTWRGASYDIDNVKAYYEGTLTAPTATYNNADLTGAVVSGTSFNAQINFTQPITEQEAAAITVNNGAAVSVQLSEDRKIVTAEVTGLKHNSSYILNVPETALNKAAQFAFETEKSAMYVQDFSTGSVKVVANRNNTYNYIVDLDNDDIVVMKRDGAATTAEVSDGKLKMISDKYSDNGSYYSRTFVKFNKDYDISKNTTNKLIVGYDLSINDVYLPKEGEGVSLSLICGGLFQYIDKNTSSVGVFQNKGTIIGNAANFGMAIQAPAPESGTKAQRAGLLLRTGNKGFAIQPEGVFKNLEFAGIFNKPLGHKFHVEYEVTPATESAEPRVTRVTISDDTESVYFEADPVWTSSYKYFDITGKTAISGISFDTWQSASYEVDNISIGYEWAYKAPQVTYGNNMQLDKSMTVGTEDKTFTYTVNENCEITDLSGIALNDENGNAVGINAANDNGTVTINVTGDFAADTAYTLTLPNAATGAISTIDKFEYNFRTKWETKEFAKPELFKDKTGLNVVFLGGSITNDPNGYRNDVMDMIKEQYQDSVFTNAGVGGTGSEYGWIRLKKDVISKNPDLVFVEFAVNDINSAEKTKYMESIVRNLNKLDNPPAIVFVCTTKLNFEDTAVSSSAQAALAKAYGIPVINVGAYMQSIYNSDEQFRTDWDNKVYLADGVHPTADCSRIYGGYICDIISGNPDKYIKLPKSNDSVTPLSDYVDYVYDYSAIAENSGSVTFKVYGDDFRLQYYQNTNGVKFNVAIDGNDMGDINAESSVDGNSNYSLMYTKEYTGLGDAWHTVTVSALEEGDVLIDTVKGVFKREAEELFEISKPVFNAETITSGTELTASTSYTTNSENNFAFIIALYNENGELTGIKSSPVTVNTSCITTDAVISIIPTDGDVTAKAFVWNSVDGMKNITDMNKLGK